MSPHGEQTPALLPLFWGCGLGALLYRAAQNYQNLIVSLAHYETRPRTFLRRTSPLILLLRACSRPKFRIAAQPMLLWLRLSWPLLSYWYPLRAILFTK